MANGFGRTRHDARSVFSRAIPAKQQLSAGRLDKKIRIIDLVRSFSILSVMAAHWGFGGVEPKAVGLKDLWVALCVRGPFGVSLFFVVSGFLITRLIDQDPGGLSRPNLRNFYVRRLGRIMPLLVLISVAGACVLYQIRGPVKPLDICIKNPSASYGWPFWLSIFTFTFNWLRILEDHVVGSYGLHWDVIWSLSIEEQFYFLYPFALKYFDFRRQLVPVFWAFIPLGLAVKWWAYHSSPDNILFVTINSFSGFGAIAVGVLLYYYLVFKKHFEFLLNRPVLSLSLCFFGLAVFAVVYSRPFHMSDFVLQPTILNLALSLFLIGGLSLPSLESKVLAFLCLPGKLSYGMYLWHSLVLYFLVPFLLGLNTWIAFLIFVLATLFLAFLSYFFYEMPANFWIRKRFEKIHNP